MIKKYYFTITNLFLITAGIYLGVNSFYKVVSAKLEHVPTTSKVTSRIDRGATEKSKPLSHYAIISDRNLFGTKGQEVKPIDEKIDTDVPQTDLNLKLWGTIAGEGSTGYAIIEDKKKRKQDLYKEGSTVQQNVLVKHILREKVILSRNGKDEILLMEQIKGGKGKTGRSGKSSSTGSGRSRSIKIKRSMVDESLANINDLMKQVKIRPHFEDGKPDGLMLSNIKSRSIFRKMGLRNGDVVLGIDGQNIESVDDALKFYEGLKSTEAVSLQIRRRGKEKTIDYKIQ